MATLAINALAVKRNTLPSRGNNRSSSNLNLKTRFKMDESVMNDEEVNNEPIFTNAKATRCYRPKEWTPEVEEGSIIEDHDVVKWTLMHCDAAFRVQQTGWRDLNEYRASYGEPDRWSNGFIRCTRVKSNGYYTYWYVRLVERIAVLSDSSTMLCMLTAGERIASVTTSTCTASRCTSTRRRDGFIHAPHPNSSSLSLSCAPNALYAAKAQAATATAKVATSAIQ